MKIATYFFCFLFALTAASTLNSQVSNPVKENVSGRPVFSDGNPSEVLTGGVPGGFSAKADTIYLLGGPDRDDGDFEDESGLPSWEGWTSIDYTAPTGIVWNVSDFNCQNLDPGTVNNRAWWCGETIGSCFQGDNGQGYGANNDEWLDWYGEVLDPVSPISVTVNAVINYDCEQYYDFLYLNYDEGGSMQVQNSWSGSATGVVVSEAISLVPDDFVPHPDTGLPAVHLRWHFISDISNDQDDCGFINDGGAQIDLIEVLFDQGTPIQMSFEDNEDLDPADNDWQPVLRPGVGDFAKVWPQLSDLDICAGNSTPAVAFIDDGQVVPGTGGYDCQNWCYGPGSYVVNPEGGLAGPEAHINNAIISPVLIWPGTSHDGAILSFDVYRHEPLLPNSPGMFYFWSVQSSDSEFPGDLANEPWKDGGYLYFGGPDWWRLQVDVSEFLNPGRQFMRIRLGVVEIGYLYYWNGTDSTPAPYFDNVALATFPVEGPYITADEINLFQDNFSANGTIDMDNLGNNSVRIDMAENISPQGDMRNDPGDSMVVRVVSIRGGTELMGPPRMYYKFRQNPLFNGVRDGGFTPEGYVEGALVFDTLGQPTDEFAFDLPDSGWFYPGDYFHWYIEARDNGTAPGLTLLPADTTGFSFFPGDQGYAPLQYPSSFVVRALPSLSDGGAGQLRAPNILFWNDFGNRGGEDEWLGALSSLGLLEGENFDLYYTNSPGAGKGNGLGGRASSEQLALYKTILYTCGNLMEHTLADGDFTKDPSLDIQVLDSWINSPNRNMFLTGDNLVSDLSNGLFGGQEFVSDVLGLQFDDPNIKPMIGNQSAPLIKTEDLYPEVFPNIDQWIANGSCPQVNTFDAVTVLSGATRLAEFTDPGGNPGAYGYAAATSHMYWLTNQVIYLPYDFMNIESAGDKALSTRELVLLDVLAQFEESIYICPPDSVMYVDIDAAGGLGYGTSWANARQSLAGALSAAQRCGGVTQIWVAEGTYHPTDGTDRTATFQLGNNLAIYGGFAGNETSLAERDWISNVTTLSGEIGNLSEETDNSYHVVNGSNTDSTAILDGFFITKGYANGAGNEGSGGGLFCRWGSPAIHNVNFLDNFADGKGGGVYAEDSNPDFFNVVISGNSADSDGGGIYNYSGSPTLTNVVIFGNSGEKGGGIYSQYGVPVLTNVTLSKNTAGRDGGGMYTKNSPAILTNAVFWGNLGGDKNDEVGYEGDDPTFSYSLAKGCGGSDQWDDNFGLDGGHNLDDNPLFVDENGGDLHLTLGSPAIDTGDNSAPNLPLFDLDGNSRIAYGQVDMGAYEFGSDVAGVDDTPEEIVPRVARLYQAFPNPFNPMTTIKFDLPKSTRVDLRIYDVSGRLVRILVKGEVVTAGQREAVWRGRDEAGRQVAAGVYFYRIEAGVFGETRRMTLVK